MWNPVLDKNKNEKKKNTKRVYRESRMETKCWTSGKRCEQRKPAKMFLTTLRKCGCLGKEGYVTFNNIILSYNTNNPQGID